MANHGPRSGVPSDAALIRAVAAGRKSAAEVFVARFWGEAHRVAYLLLYDRGAAEEVAQDALLAAIRAIDTFDLDRPFMPWLQRIAANRAIDRLRSRRHGIELAVDDVESVADESGAIADEIARRALSEELSEALASLDPAFRAPVVLRHLIGCTTDEIAELLDIPAATARTRIHRGLVRLRDLLPEREGEAAHERAG